MNIPASPFDLDAIGAGLPVTGALPEIAEALEAHHRAVVEAPPGTGKTTLVPPLVADLLARRAGDADAEAADTAAAGTGTAPLKTIVTAPRRVAVRAAARRLHHLSGNARAVGHRVRGDSQAGSAVEFVTPAVLVRMLLSDPELPEVGAVVIDEVHERELDTDLALAFSAELAALREDLDLVVMSATLDTTRFSELLGEAPVVSTPAVTHPLETSYHPHPGRMAADRRSRDAFWAHLAALADAAVEKSGHSALVFVPGAREVEQTVAACRTRALPLHGRLERAAQDAALDGTGPARVVVSTAVAESSVTVPGVRTVVDSGLSRVPRRDSGRGMSGLVTVSEARSTAEQRAGRAGREGPGTVLRAFTSDDLRHFDAHVTPEIDTADLTQAALWMACWGTPRGEGLALVSEPQPAAIAAAEETLRALHAVDAEGRPTELGRRLADLPLDPRLGRALLTAGPSAAEVLAALSDGASGDLGRASAPSREVARLRAVGARGAGGAAADAGDTAHRKKGGDRRGATSASDGVAVGLAFPERIARREGGGEYLLASGTRAVLPGDTGLSGAEWLAVGEVTRSGTPGRAGRAGATIRSAARIDEADALEIIGVTEELRADFADGKLRGRAVRRAGAIELAVTPTTVPPERAAEAVAAAVREEGTGMFRLGEKAAALRDRLAFLHERVGEPWPDPETAEPEVWLAPEIQKAARGTPPGKIDLFDALQRLLPWPEATRMDELAPQRLEVPSGSHPRVDYSTGRPVVRVKLQECFGLAESPRCAGVPVQFRLLSPAGRDLAVTDDLESFWSGPYAQVRAEMRGRYPKHPWPEDPWSATATARTKKRM
ncbi:helicase [Corynebacterium frankenforstense DSM 45800]|uniref:RNA helicase n=1 Tax=Corynebacterium frankenforstense DSM 45800 TaxID=1437875 RepID=A0A1L7CQC9_9CORY|nr:ATP-dependent helicase HrpB [Corynebacterium frankenforstense]APT88050.1 helicase [Corynebacterium frankenforstense DSM 45800]